ncbi:unnamed protein product [Staurois parvus]|uniref:Uncharacterized protein n=1 Tax=Staurois parvus TaxID=386267 RepID=A0ABN9FT98_9NEOB|nr:unnamed protein product [Staurois parvus]
MSTSAASSVPPHQRSLSVPISAAYPCHLIMPPVSAHQCQIPVIISAHQCHISVPMSTHQCHISVPIRAAF